MFIPSVRIKKEIYVGWVKLKDGKKKKKEIRKMKHFILDVKARAYKIYRIYIHIIDTLGIYMHIYKKYKFISHSHFFRPYFFFSFVAPLTFYLFLFLSLGSIFFFSADASLAWPAGLSHFLVACRATWGSSGLSEDGGVTCGGCEKKKYTCVREPSKRRLLTVIRG